MFVTLKVFALNSRQMKITSHFLITILTEKNQKQQAVFILKIRNYVVYTLW